MWESVGRSGGACTDGSELRSLGLLEKLTLQGTKPVLEGQCSVLPQRTVLAWDCWAG